ncbi:MAG: PAS domain S-box protein [Planctomycetota bacterium]
MIRSLFDSLGEVHRFDDLEALLDHAAGVIRDASGWRRVFLTFYFGQHPFYGAVGCPADIKERFRRSFHLTTEARRERKRAMMLEFGRPGTNICFIPAGQGPDRGSAFVAGPKPHGTWEPEDRLIIFMRSRSDDITGLVSLDDPGSGDRPAEDDYRLLEDVDRYVNIVGKIAENRLWGLRLEESEKAYRAIFDATTDAILITDLEGRIVKANPAACRMHGYPVEELVGKDCRDLVHKDSWSDYDRFLTDVAAGSDFQVEARDLRKDGSSFDIEVRAATFRYQGRPHLLAVLHDVTEQKRVFRRLLEQQKEESVMAVAGGVAHDFNNILMGITGSASLLARHLGAGSEAARQVARIQASADRLAGLTGQLLAVARGIHSEPRPITLRTVVENGLGLLEGLTGTDYRLDVTLPDDPWTVLADRVQMGQVLLNLAQNACDAMERGGRLRVAVENVRRDEPWTCEITGPHPAGDFIRLRVQDDGAGMDETVRRRIFDPYFSTKADGSGLGLAAVLGIVRRHEGAVGLESEPGVGTRIEILLPRSDASVAIPLGAPKVTPPPEARRKILLVEDADMVRTVTAELLVRLGYDVIAASSGQQALALHEHDPGGIDVVLLDVEMPGMTGVEVADALLTRRPETRIVLTSGHTDRVLAAARPEGSAPVGFLQKPYTLSALAAALAAAFGAAGVGMQEPT